MRGVSTKQAALTVIAVTVVLATVFYPATFFARRSSL
jgi:multidrug efflux pump subunit AcrB